MLSVAVCILALVQPKHFLMLRCIDLVEPDPAEGKPVEGEIIDGKLVEKTRPVQSELRNLLDA